MKKIITISMITIFLALFSFSSVTAGDQWSHLKRGYMVKGHSWNHRYSRDSYYGSNHWQKHHSRYHNWHYGYTYNNRNHRHADDSYYICNNESPHSEKHYIWEHKNIINDHNNNQNHSSDSYWSW